MKAYQNRSSYKIMTSALNLKDVSISDLAALTGRSLTSIYFYVHGERKWSLESWLDVLCVLGKLEAGPNFIKISGVKLTDETLTRFNTLRAKKHGK